MPESRPLPPINELRRKLAYRSDGVLIWKRPTAKSVKPGHPAGCLNNMGYFHINFKGHTILNHRVIWAILKREDPLNYQIDHINGNKSDNKIKNLRKVTHGQNMRNKPSAKGFYFVAKEKKWAAAIRVNKKKVSLGRFDTEEQAREAYLRAKEKLHGEFMPSDMKHELAQIDGPTSQLNFFDD